MSAGTYIEVTLRIVERVVASQRLHLEAAGAMVADALGNGHRLWAFGTGHSHLLAEELYERAGGLAEVHAVLEPALMLHEGARKSSALERLPGLAGILLDHHPIAAGDVVVIASNSGRNAVPVEFAAGSRARGAKVIAVTSRAHSASVPSRAPGGRRLYDVADVVIDNCGVPGDAALEGDPPYGATSTVTGALIVQAIVCEAISRMTDPHILRSFNVDGPRAS
ncbi:SIS domain-containing protein [Kribbella deserti]|uniref:SIS domain-containing protein n=1 Tax=Kribbella deserti TaxID=1926257 RepID=A0ABV6QR35_9ACTN